MDNKYLITVVGEQEVDGNKEKIEIITTGDYMEKDKHKYISYKEYLDDNPEHITDTLIDISPTDYIKITRTNDYKTCLLLQKGTHHQCHYTTPMGEIMMGIYTKDITDKLTKHGGDLILDYRINFYSNVVSNNKFHINIKENNYVENKQ